LRPRKLIAVFFGNMSFRSLGDDVLGDLVRSLGEVRRSRDLNLVFYDRKDRLDAFEGTGEWRDYDGVLGCIPSSDPVAVAAWERLERRLPCVAFLSAPLSESVHRHYVGIDERSACELLVSHVGDQGARSIGWCAFAAERFTRQRFEGYRSALARRGWPLRQAWVHGFSVETGAPLPGRWRATPGNRPSTSSRLSVYRRLLAAKPRPDAILCEGDPMGLELMAEARRLGLRVPEDLMVTGFDNSRSILGARPELTTIHQDFRRIAREALLLLLELIGKPRPGPEAILLPPRLLARASTLRRGDRTGEPNEAERRRDWGRRLDRHLGDPGPAALLAGELGLSTPYFLRRWRALMGKPFVKDLNDRRLEKAARSLRSTKKSVTLVYLECGFSNHVHFNRLFRRAYGQTARAYRNTY